MRGNILISLVLLLQSLISLSSAFTCEMWACDPNAMGITFHPHLTDCGRFCRCSGGVAEEYICPEGLYFNPALDVCDWPANVECPIAFTCDMWQCGTYELSSLPNLADCEKFCLCRYGYFQDITCGPGLHFNPVLHYCESAESAGCAV